MNWQLVGNIALTIALHFQLGIGSSTHSSPIMISATDLHGASEQSISEQKVSYTIDANEVVAADYISSGLIKRTEQRLKGAKTGRFMLPVVLTKDEPTIFARLTSKDGNILAEDVVIYGAKESLSFSASSSARVSILRTAFLFSVEGDRIIEIYTEIDSHPRFNELVELYRAEKRLPTDEARSDAAAEMTAEITIDLLYSISIIDPL